MKIIVAPDSFKGSISAIKACEVIEKGIHVVLSDAEVIKLPIADGGEGTVDAFVAATSCKTISVQVKGPLGKKVEAKFAVLDDNTGIIEMALASGLTLLDESQRNPMITTSYGTGELMKSALDFGCKKIIIGLGGSATNDGGLGLAQALGYSFKDIDGKELGYGGGGISRLHSIDCSNRDIRLDSCDIIAACDVKNILCGSKGASYVFGPQKGATQEMVTLLDENLNHYATIIEN